MQSLSITKRGLNSLPTSRRIDHKSLNPSAEQNIQDTVELGRPVYAKMGASAMAIMAALGATGCAPPAPMKPVSRETQVTTRADSAYAEKSLEKDAAATVAPSASGAAEAKPQDETAKELKALRQELAEMRKDREADEAFRKRQDAALKARQMKQGAEVAGAVATGVVCILLGAISDSPGC